MKKIKIGIIGHFAENQKFNDGQTIKTRELYKELIKDADMLVSKVDTYNYKKNKIGFLYKCINLLKNNQFIVLIVASGGANVLVPTLTFLNFFYRKKICYCAIGSWVDVRVKNNFILDFFCKKIDLILVETDDLKQSLISLKYNNVEKMYNFKEIIHSNEKTDRIANSFCIFSRIIKEKGINDAIYSVKKLNNESIKCTLDIYGPIDSKYEKEFNELIKGTDYIKYCGCVEAAESEKVLSRYSFLLFPTHYEKEGLPGTIIDSYYAKTVVIASAWKSATEFISAEIGYVYDFANKEKLYETMKFCLQNPVDVETKRKNISNDIGKFEPKQAINPLRKFLKNNGPIKVMQIIPNLGVGGAEKLVLELSEKLDNEKFKVFVVTFYDKNDFEFDYSKYKNINFISLHKKKGFDISVLIKLGKLFKQVRPNVVHTHTYVVPYVLIPSILRRIKCKVHTVHSIAEYELSESKKKIMYIGYHWFKIIPVAISPTVRKSIQDVYNIDNVELIHNCIDLSVYKKKSFKKNKSIFTIVNVARLSEVKNHELMIDSFERAYKANNNIRLNIVGDGVLRKDLEKKVKRLKLNKYIKFYGISNNVQNQLRKSDAFILTSKFEGLPLSILEAMSCGLPIIATNVGGVKDIVIDNFNGYLTETNCDSIADAIIKLSTNQKKYNRFSRNSLKLSKKYDINNMVKEYECLYEKQVYNKK